MKKQVYNNLFKAMLLPVIVVLLTLWVATGVVAGSGDTYYTLELNFSDKIDSYTIETVHPSTLETVTTTIKDLGNDGKETIDIVYDSRVTVTINSKTGYWPESVTCTGGENAPELQANTLTWPSFDASYTIAVVCVDREYKVIAENIDGSAVPPLLYSIDDPDWTLGINALYDGTLTYQKGRLPLTELPVVKLQNHTFEGWNIVVGDTTIPITVSEDGNYYIPADLTILKSFDDEGGKIRVCPILKPVTYEVYRQDHIYDPSISGNRGELLLKPPVSSMVTAGTLISAIQSENADWYAWDDDKNGYRQYAGYTLLEDLTKYAPHRVSKPTESNEKYNTVVRFYVPITYTLVYYDDNGELLTAYEGVSEYVYGNETDVIARPTRNGWIFTGWTVQVYKNGEWQTATDKTALDFAFGIEGDATFTDGVRNDPNAIYASDKQSDGSYEIRLVANWTPDEYEITYDWNVPAELVAEMEETNSALVNGYNLFLFASGDKIIPAPVRTGYNFLGWALTWVKDGQTVTVPYDTLKELVDSNGNFTLKTGDYYSDIILTAQWEAKTYDVILNPGEDGTAGETDELEAAVRFDAQLVIDSDVMASIIPTRRGYTFLGFFSEDGVQYINADGTATAGVLWKEDGANDTVTLYAHWQVNYYDISVNVSGVTDQEILDGIEIKVFTEDGEALLTVGQAYAIRYGASFTVQIKTPSGYKVVWWSESGNVSHTAIYSADLTCEWIEAKSFEVKVLPVQSLDVTVDHNVDYRKEEITGLANGDYMLYIEGMDEPVSQRVTDGKIRIENAWFGKSVALVLCGNGTESSDSEPCVLALAARPAAPDEKRTQNPDGEIEQIRVRDSEIVITMASGFEGLFEFAIRERGSDAALVWQSNGRFDTNIQAGTWYEIYVRRAATDDAPCGESFSRDEITTHGDYVDEKKAELDALLDENSGDIAKKLIADKKAEIDALADKDELDADFYEKVEAIVQAVRDSELALANRKDETLALLDGVLAGCLERGFYSNENYSALMGYYQAVTDAITIAPDQASVMNLYEEAKQQMEAIDLRAVIDADRLILLESLLGLDQESVLTLIRNSSIEDISRAISEAIRTSGKVAVGDFTTQEKAEQLLRELDVVAYYKFDLLGSETVKNGDVFTITLQVPNDLRGKTGLQVAYYNEETGVIELLETKVSEDGKTLTFYTTRVADFVILADPTVNLFGVIIALGGVLLFQMIALALILVSRSKNKKNAMHASVAFPIAFLTVHFAPVGGEVIALALAAAVIIMQIVLMILLLKSDVIYRPKKREDADLPVFPEAAYGNANALTNEPVTEADEEMTVFDEEPIVLDESEEGDGEDADVAFMAAFTYGAASEAAEANAETLEEIEEIEETEEDPFALYEEEIVEEEVYEDETEEAADEDFIEPAAYSAFDEEFARLDEEFAQLDEELDADEAEDVEAVFGGEETLDEGDLYEENPDALFEELYAETGDLYEENPDALYEEIAEEQYAEEAVDGSETVDDDLFASDEEQFVYADDATADEGIVLDDTDPMYRYDE